MFLWQCDHFTRLLILDHADQDSVAVDAGATLCPSTSAPDLPLGIVQTAAADLKSEFEDAKRIQLDLGTYS